MDRKLYVGRYKCEQGFEEFDLRSKYKGTQPHHYDSEHDDSSLYFEYLSFARFLIKHPKGRISITGKEEYLC